MKKPELDVQKYLRAVNEQDTFALVSLISLVVNLLLIVIFYLVLPKVVFIISIFAMMFIAPITYALLEKRYAIYHTLDDLEDEYGIRSNISPCGKLVNLKYSQIDSPKMHQIVRECRGLILEVGTWNIVAQPFYRFFNYGEDPTIEAEDVANMSIMEKLDGSLITLFKYKNEWRMSTSGGIDNNSDVLTAHGIGYMDTRITFKELFYDALSTVCPNWQNTIDDSYTYTFELTSPENRTVTKYETRSVTVIGARYVSSNTELGYNELATVARTVGLPMCKKFDLGGNATFKDLIDTFKTLPPLDEGYVAVDYNSMDEYGNFKRVKIKNPSYVAKHQLKDQACNSKKALLGVVLTGEIDEVVSVFPEYHDTLLELKDTWDNWCKRHEDWLQYIKDNDLSPKEIGLQTPKNIVTGLIFSIHNGKIKNIDEWVQNQIEKRTFGNACKYILNTVEGK
jgi:hypothetical protein